MTHTESRKGASFAQGAIDKVAADNGWTRRAVPGARLALDEYRRSGRRLDVAWTSDGRVHSCDVRVRGIGVHYIAPSERGKLAAVLIELTADPAS
jgi:hypothetical protein